MSTDPYWRIIGDQQKFYDFELLKAEAEQEFICSCGENSACVLFGFHDDLVIRV